MTEMLNLVHQKNLNMDITTFRPITIGKETFHPTSFNESEVVMNYKLQKGGMVPPHHHIHMDEHFSVLKGTMKFKVNGETVYKKEGEEIMVPRGVTHSISNAGDEQVEMTVKYMPNADCSRTFELISTFDKQNPGKMSSLFKAMYVGQRIGLKDFSTPSPAFILPIISGIVTITGKLSGWDKLVKEFK
jgi:quercetin dioxygenase-like cupin family protein